MSTMMPALNLPNADLKTKQENGRPQVFDILRQRYVALTPEEWVRQHFVHFLISNKHYPKGRIANETALQVGEMKKRCDSVVYGSNAKPIVIIEYKSPSVAVTQRVFDQICRYNMKLQVPYLIISNGIQHFCCRINYDDRRYEFLTDIPDYENI